MNTPPGGPEDPTRPVGGQEPVDGAAPPWYQRPAVLVPLGLLSLLVIVLLVAVVGGDSEEVADDAGETVTDEDVDDEDDEDGEDGEDVEDVDEDADEGAPTEGREPGEPDPDMDDTDEDAVAIPRGRAGGGLESSTFTVRLSWENEVDDEADPPALGQGQEGATGVALLRLDSDQGIVCADFVVDGVDEADAFTGAHLHQGGPDENGPVVAAFETPDERGESSTCTNTFTDGFEPIETLQAVEANPSGWYLNVHTEAFPDGVVRGQLPEEQDAAPEEGATGR